LELHFGSTSNAPVEAVGIAGLVQARRCAKTAVCGSLLSHVLETLFKKTLDFDRNVAAKKPPDVFTKSFVAFAKYLQGVFSNIFITVITGG